MARRQILSLSDRESLLALPEDELTLTRMAYFSEHDLALISAHRKPAMPANTLNLNLNIYGVICRTMRCCAITMAKNGLVWP